MTTSRAGATPGPSRRGTTVVHRSVPTPAAGGRLDAVLVSRGLARSRGHARDLVDAGVVLLDGRPADRVAVRVGPDTDVAVDDASGTYVGRAAHKLVAAIDAFGPLGLRIEGRHCLDIGASTGGFTQVLLEHRAAQVVALDVGHGQLAVDVKNHPRVVERSGVNVRHVGPDDIDGPFDLVVGDLSFISLRLVWPVIAAQLAADGDAVLLIKPQFEVGRQGLGKGGVVRSSAQRLAAVSDVVRTAREVGLGPVHLRRSPLPGGSGNREYLGWFRKHPSHVLDESGADALVRTLDDEGPLREDGPEREDP